MKMSLRRRRGVGGSKNPKNTLYKDCPLLYGNKIIDKAQFKDHYNFNLLFEFNLIIFFCIIVTRVNIFLEPLLNYHEF